MSKPSPLLQVGCATVFSALCMTVQAQSISPSSVTQTINVGETFTINKTITLGATGATNVDVFFLADNTGSMGSTVGKAQSGATAILNALPATYQFGVGRYFGDPSEGVLPANSFQQLTSLTSSKPAVQTGINGWIASGGGDTPEGNFYALKQVADTAAWRPDAQRLVVWFGDATSHTETTTQAQAIAALQGANAKVVAFNNTVAGAGIDGIYAGQPSGTKQASDIISAVGGSLTNSFLSVSNADFITAVTNQISLAASSVNLAFGSTFAGSGLSLAFACTDILGCNNVGAGQSRTFDLSITGLLPGTYNFNVFAQGIGAIETDSITVLSTAAIPEPSTYALFLCGLAAVGAISRRRSGEAPRA